MSDELFFVHIPKNAGNSIKDVAKENGILWGRWHPILGEGGSKNGSKYHQI
jgi:hypothetical protein